MGRGGAVALAALLVLAARPDPAAAQDWRFSVGANVSETYTDNATLAPDGRTRESDFITRVAPTFALRGQGGRVNANINYSPQRIMFANGTGRDRFRHSLAARGRAELVRQMVFLDTQASVSEQIVDLRNQVSENPDNDTNNRSTVQAYRVAPSFRHRLGGWASTEARTAYGKVVTDSQNVSNRESLSSTFAIRSGPEFSRLGWGVTLSRSEDIGNQRGGLTDSNLDIDGRYTINRFLSVVGSVGYDDIEDNSLSEDPTSASWSIGFLSNPSPRTNFRLTYGQRFNSSNISLSAVHTLASGIRLSASITERIINTQRQVLEDLSFVGVDDEGNLIDTRTGDPFTPRDPNVSLVDQTFKQSTYRVGVNGRLERTGYNLSLSHTQRDILLANDLEVTDAFSVGLTRQHGYGLRSAVRMSFRHTDFGDVDPREDDVMTGSATLSRALGQNVNGSLSYAATRRESTQANGDLTENAVTVRVGARF